MVSNTTSISTHLKKALSLISKNRSLRKKRQSLSQSQSKIKKGKGGNWQAKEVLRGYRNASSAGKIYMLYATTAKAQASRDLPKKVLRKIGFTAKNVKWSFTGLLASTV